MKLPLILALVCCPLVFWYSLLIIYVIRQGKEIKAISKEMKDAIKEMERRVTDISSGILDKNKKLVEDTMEEV